MVSCFALAALNTHLLRSREVFEVVEGLGVAFGSEAIFEGKMSLERSLPTYWICFRRDASRFLLSVGA